MLFDVLGTFWYKMQEIVQSQKHLCGCTPPHTSMVSADMHASEGTWQISWDIVFTSIGRHLPTCWPTFDPDLSRVNTKIRISSSSQSLSGCWWQIWRNSLPVFLRTPVHEPHWIWPLTPNFDLGPPKYSQFVLDSKWSTVAQHLSHCSPSWCRASLAGARRLRGHLLALRVGAFSQSQLYCQFVKVP